MPSPASERGSATVTLATVAALLLLIVAVIAGAAGGITGQEAAACTAQPAAAAAGSWRRKGRQISAPTPAHSSAPSCPAAPLTTASNTTPIVTGSIKGSLPHAGCVPMPCKHSANGR